MYKKATALVQLITLFLTIKAQYFNIYDKPSNLNFQINMYSFFN